MGKGASCPNLNVFGLLSCRYTYAHDKKYKESGKTLSANLRISAKSSNFALQKRLKSYG